MFITSQKKEKKMQDDITVYYKPWDQIHMWWGLHHILKSLVDYLKDNKNANVIEKDEFVYNNRSYKVNDSHCLIYNKQKDSYTLITFTDQQCELICFLNARNNPNDTLVCSQLSKTNVFDIPRNYKIVPNIYAVSRAFMIYDDPVDLLYEKRLLRKSQSGFLDKLLFRGNCAISGCDRRAVLLLTGQHDFVGWEPNDTYFTKDLIECSVGLSVPGIGELCMRDIEYMSVGIPMLRFKYIREETLNPSLVPNYHYISIDRMDNDATIERTAGNGLNPLNYSLKYLEKFNEVRKDLDFLEYISKNARKYYEDYLHPNTRLNHLLKISELT